MEWIKIANTSEEKHFYFYVLFFMCYVLSPGMQLKRLLCWRLWICASNHSFFSRYKLPKAVRAHQGVSPARSLPDRWTWTLNSQLLYTVLFVIYICKVNVCEWGRVKILSINPYLHNAHLQWSNCVCMISLCEIIWNYTIIYICLYFICILNVGITI